MTEDQTSMKQAVAELKAGDLTEVEATAVQAEIDAKPELQQEAQFWDQALPALKDHGRPDARVPGPGMADVIRKRLHQDETSSPTNSDAESTTVIPFPEWLRYAGSAAAAVVITALLMLDPGSKTAEHQKQAGALVAYNEHGDAIYVPQLKASAKHSEQTKTQYLPLHQITHLDVKTAKTISHQQAARPYLGLLVKPITLDNSHHASGALVLQVYGDSPAEKAGLQPGDVILTLAQCPMMTNFCIPNALKNKKPGDPVDAIYFDKSADKIISTSIRLGATYE